MMSKLNLVGKKLVGATFYQKGCKLVLFTENEAVELSHVEICRDREAVLNEEITGLDVEKIYGKVTITFKFANKQNFRVQCFQNFRFNPCVSFALKCKGDLLRFDGKVARSSDSTKVMILGNNIYLPRIVEEEMLAKLAEDYPDTNIAFEGGCVADSWVAKYFAPREGETEIWE